MNREQAKRVLLARRPGSRDDADPAIAEALHLVQRDPGMQEWLQHQSAFHARVQSELRSMPVPAGLKERILTQRKIVVPLWRRPEWILLAAGFALALILAGLWFRSSSSEQTLAGFRSRMVGSALRLYQMDIETNDLNRVREYLREKGAPADYALTPALQNASVKGGARLSWQGSPVAMVCFALPKNETLYLFVMNQTAMPRQELPGASPVLTEVHGLMTASWNRDGKVYLAAAPTDSALLQ